MGFLFCGGLLLSIIKSKCFITICFDYNGVGRVGYESTCTNTNCIGTFFCNIPRLSLIHIFTAEAFSTVFGRFGGGFVAVSLALFAFSTLLGWSYYGQRAAAYLMGERVIPVYKAAFLLAAVAGCMMRLEPVWALSDTFNGLMALPNLAGVLALRRQVIAESFSYTHLDVYKRQVQGAR